MGGSGYYIKIQKTMNTIYCIKLPFIAELKAAFRSLRRVVAEAVEHDAIVPSMAGKLERLKYSTETELPT